jgi:hypothetical protein
VLWRGQETRGPIGQLVTASSATLRRQKDISEQMDELLKKFQQPATGSIIQSNSGGVNVLQGTTGANSPIINSPITIGKVPKTIPPDLADELVAFLKAAPTKAKVDVMVDQLSGVEPSARRVLRCPEESRGPLAATGASHVMALYAPGRIPQIKGPKCFCVEIRRKRQGTPRWGRMVPCSTLARHSRDLV